MQNISFSVTEENEGIRLDKFLAEQMEDFSRNYVQTILADGLINVSGNSRKAGYRVKYGDTVNVTVPEKVLPEIRAEDIPLDILYEDKDIIVVNKPQGMVVHPAAGHYSGTLVNALMYHCSDLSGINGVLRPGIVHRIDKDTSGVLVCAKNDFAHSYLSEQLKEHSITRKYEAVALGNFKDKNGTVTGNIGRSPKDRKMMAIVTTGGKEAVTHYHVLTQFKNNAHIECKLETGRTHQIRVHMKSIGHPLLGDLVYGGKLCGYKLDGLPLCGQTLHAKTLGFVHPSTKEYMEFTADLPDYFKKLLIKFAD